MAAAISQDHIQSNRFFSTANNALKCLASSVSLVARKAFQLLKVMLYHTLLSLVMYSTVTVKHLICVVCNPRDIATSTIGFLITLVAITKIHFQVDYLMLKGSPRACNIFRYSEMTGAKIETYNRSIKSH